MCRVGQVVETGYLRPVLRVGLTGGIGAGKTAVSFRLARLGAVVIDSDVLAREVLEPGTEGLGRVVAEFGPEVLTADGRLDRARLADTVFGDEQRRQALNAIVHPLVRARAGELTAAAPADAVVVHDVPLLVESGLEADYDVVVVVDVPVDVALDRLVRSRGMPAAQARARIAAQAGREERLRVADVVIDNSGTPTDLEHQVDALWERLRGQHGAR